MACGCGDTNVTYERTKRGYIARIGDDPFYVVSRVSETKRRAAEDLARILFETWREPWTQILK